MSVILFLAILIEFTLIYVLSRRIFQLLYTLFYLPTKHHNASKYITTFLFLPGTMIHEFSHAIVAVLVRAKIGRIMLYPHRDKETGEYKAGAIEIEKVDPVRLALIGIAPTLIGLMLLSLSVFYIYHFQLPLFADWQKLLPDFNTVNLLIFLGIFMVSMTMFTSKRDLAEFLLVVPALLIIGVLLYYAGFRVTLSEGLLNFFQELLNRLAFVLGLTLAVDIVIFVFLFVPVTLLLQLLKK